MATSPFLVLARRLSTTSTSNQLVKAPVQLFTLEGRYATALYSAATKQKALQQVEKDITDINAIIQTDKPLQELLYNPLLKKDLKKEAIQSVLSKKKANPLTVNFFNALAENGRLRQVNEVVSSFQTIMAAERGQIMCEVTTAKEVDAATKKEIEAALMGFLKKGQTLSLTMRVNPAIIGGMLVSIGDKFVDMSIASKVNKYTALLNQPV